jgi:hypothetical protein
MNSIVLQSAIRRGFWLAATALTFWLYVAKPYWPNSVRHFPWRWPAAPVFCLVLCVLAFLIHRLGFARAMAYSLVVLSVYFFAEGLVGSFLFAELGVFAPGSRRQDIPLLGLVDLYSNLPVVATFLAMLAVWFLFASRSREGQQP